MSPGGTWTETVVHTFGLSTSLGSVQVSNRGVLYGTTSAGRFGHGGVFALYPPRQPGDPWTESLLYSFTGSGGDGAQPGGFDRLAGTAGQIYGTTTGGGASNNGTVFSLMPPGNAG